MEATTELLKELNIKKVRRGSELLDEDFDDDDTDTDSDVSEEETTAIVTCVADAVDLDGHDDDDGDASIESHAMPCHTLSCTSYYTNILPIKCNCSIDLIDLPVRNLRDICPLNKTQKVVTLMAHNKYTPPAIINTGTSRTTTDSKERQKHSERSDDE